MVREKNHKALGEVVFLVNVVIKMGVFVSLKMFNVHHAVWKKHKSEHETTVTCGCFEFIAYTISIYAGIDFCGSRTR